MTTNSLLYVKFRPSLCATLKVNMLSENNQNKRPSFLIMLKQSGVRAYGLSRSSIARRTGVSNFKWQVTNPSHFSKDSGLFTYLQLGLRPTMMVAGMRLRMRPPSMLSTVTSLPLMAKRQARQMTLQPGQGGLGERTVGGGLGASSQLGEMDLLEGFFFLSTGRLDMNGIGNCQ